MSLFDLLGDALAAWDQHCAMHTAWDENIDEMDVTEADDIAYECSGVLEWHDIDTHEIVSE